MNKILFIVKKRHFYGDNDNVFISDDNHKLTSGLKNSVLFVDQMLCHNGIFSKIVEVIDNNEIDKQVHDYKPTHVIIEGLWVVPEKFEILSRLHSNVKWIVRIHSEIPFLAMEGIAIDWILKYMNYSNVIVACNAKRAVRDLRNLISNYHLDWNDNKIEQKIILLPNYYPTKEKLFQHKNHNGLNIGCFGAIRPMKNQLIQAVAAIKYASKYNKNLNFYINDTRIEQGGNNNLKNISSLFDGNKYKLISCPWVCHDDFLKLLNDMDLSMCVSFSESFCIVAADAVNERIPLVSSSEVSWSVSASQANPNDADSIVCSMERVLNPVTRNFFINTNYINLFNYCENTRNIWVEYFKR